MTSDDETLPLPDQGSEETTCAVCDSTGPFKTELVTAAGAMLRCNDCGTTFVTGHERA